MPYSSPLHPTAGVAVSEAQARAGRNEFEQEVRKAIALGVKVGLLIEPDERAVTIYRPEDKMTLLGDREILTVPELFPGWELQSPVSGRLYSKRVL